MNDLKSSYIKKTVIFPLVTVAILIVVAALSVPKIIASLPVATDKTQAVKTYNAKDYDYYLKEFDSFEELRLNRFVGWISSDDVALGCAVTYNSEDEDTKASSLMPESTEPWNNGCVMIVGDNTDDEFRNLHKASVGDEVTVDFYAKDSYTYKIKQIEVNLTRDEILKYKKDNTLILCRPYKNFEKDGSYFYTIYIAEAVQN
ncbi:sortase domain-bontaining protein [uncultured Eubacterium sp.]|uniref:sortase domain-containing protein n=1 Tax=uncultured Eubacterium sp. TaxID=165185 RepID=UPI0015AA9562|nr:sortase [uncultured Eubacterium sp.]